MLKKKKNFCILFKFPHNIALKMSTPLSMSCAENDPYFYIEIYFFSYIIHVIYIWLFRFYFSFKYINIMVKVIHCCKVMKPYAIF